MRTPGQGEDDDRELSHQPVARGRSRSTPDKAFFVKVGLGQTMTPQDVLEGLMIVEIGMAAVRPAEFIILRFSHKLQEA
jgi:phage tail sheath protein FI